MINIKLAQNPTSHMKTDTRQVMLLVSLEAAQNKHIYIYIWHPVCGIWFDGLLADSFDTFTLILFSDLLHTFVTLSAPLPLK